MQNDDDVISFIQYYAQSVQKLLCQREETLCVAESLTGGLLSTVLTEEKGASRFFSGSVVAYSYQVKTEQLAVSSLLLKKKGAVCEEVAQQMARGVKKTFNGTWGLSVTGVAGPSLMPKDPPVGTVFIALTAKKEIIKNKLFFTSTKKEEKTKKGLLPPCFKGDSSLNRLFQGEEDEGFFREKTRCLSEKDLVFFVKKLQMRKSPLSKKKTPASQTGKNRVKTLKTAFSSGYGGEVKNTTSSLLSKDFMRQNIREQTVLYALKFLDRVLKLCDLKKK